MEKKVDTILDFKGSTFEETQNGAIRMGSNKRLIKLLGRRLNGRRRSNSRRRHHLLGRFKDRWFKGRRGRRRGNEDSVGADLADHGRGSRRVFVDWHFSDKKKWEGKRDGNEDGKSESERVRLGGFGW